MLDVKKYMREDTTGDEQVSDENPTEQHWEEHQGRPVRQSTQKSQKTTRSTDFVK